jgi:hypothetical protein
MNRCLAFLLALLFATVSVSSACVAAPEDVIRFTLQPERGDSAKIHASFRDQALERRENRSGDENSWSTGFMPSELIGMDVSSFRAAGTRPLRFAIVREAGRLDCAGNAGNSSATGNCSFTADPGFTNLLVSRGIGRPTREQQFGLTAVNARREVIEAVAAAHYPTPSIDNLMALAALGVDGRYISDMSRVGYRPNTLQSLVEFKALGITPEWIGGFTRIGYGNAPSEELVQLKALNVTPEFITGFDRIGYRHLPVSTLIQLKALDISPEFVRSAVSQRGTMPHVNELVEMKILERHSSVSRH